MGSSFYRSGFGKILGQNASHSFMRNAPGVFRGFGMDPMAHAADKYDQANAVATTPTPFAGVQPTLADANRGYVLASQKIAQQKQQPDITIPQTPPRAWMG